MADPQIERFLYREALLMDEHRFDEWLSLWVEGGSYWVPCNADDIDPKRQVSLIYDDYVRLRQRVDRLKSGSVQAFDPAPRMRRLISNIETFPLPDPPPQTGEGREGGDEVTVGSNFILCIARSADQQFWSGRTIHRLRQTPDGLKIAHKKVLLINNDQEMPLLQFLI
jgi:3-phenylpropionate/cinnamic acid dioxygenase small subunit